MYSFVYLHYITLFAFYFQDSSWSSNRSSGYQQPQQSSWKSQGNQGGTRNTYGQSQQGSWGNQGTGSQTGTWGAASTATTGWGGQQDWSQQAGYQQPTWGQVSAFLTSELFPQLWDLLPSSVAC